jgi:hypothetical protein
VFERGNFWRGVDLRIPDREHAMRGLRDRVRISKRPNQQQDSAQTTKMGGAIQNHRRIDALYANKTTVTTLRMEPS